MKKQHTPPLSSIKAAEYLGVSDSWMRKKRMSGDGPAFLRIGGAIRYRILDLDIYMKENQRTRTDET